MSRVQCRAGLGQAPGFAVPDGQFALASRSKNPAQFFRKDQPFARFGKACSRRAKTRAVGGRR
jgi:hypothetical protein